MNNLVLVVDDDDDVGVIFSMYLEMEGLLSIEAKSGNEALAILKTNKDIKFVISDVRMPNGNGIFLLEEMRKIDPVYPHIVLISGQADISREDAIKKGALELFSKPTDIDAMITLIKNTLQVL